jgi:hypothetical protein
MPCASTCDVSSATTIAVKEVAYGIQPIPIQNTDSPANRRASEQHAELELDRAHGSSGRGSRSMIFIDCHLQA